MQCYELVRKTTLVKTKSSFEFKGSFDPVSPPSSVTALPGGSSVSLTVHRLSPFNSV